MNNEIILPAFPLPPSINDCYADVVRGKYVSRILTKSAKNYKQLVSDLMNQSGYTTLLREFIEAHTTVDVWMYVYRSNWYCKNGVPQRPNRNAGDADNRVKILQDTLFKCTGIDDSSAFFTGCRKLPQVEGLDPKVIVRFTKTRDEVDEF